MDQELLSQILGHSVRNIRPLSGGDVSSVSLIETADGNLVVKSNSAMPSGFFHCEADGLFYVRSTNTFRVPEVVLVNDAPNTPAKQRLIALEYMEEDSGRLGSGFGHRFGQQLAQLHQFAPSSNNRYGFPNDNYVGSQPQINTWHENWHDFYANTRIRPQLAKLNSDRQRDKLVSRLNHLIDKLPEILADMPHQPCLIHGDLWSGNFIASGGLPVLIDPAVYYGHPEIEWAFIELFGGFPDGMREGYDSVAPLDRGYLRRKPALQLYHLLIHLIHFGATYAPPIEAICETYGV